MLITHFRRTSVALVIGVLSQAFGNAQAPPAPAAFAPTAVIPLDAAVTTGTLPNGLRYYIRKNARPEKRVMLQLAVKAGSVDETDAQQGLAHFLEHMGFNGTTRFKPGELVAALESTGARLGPHVNAQTGFDDTIYMFQLPTDKAGIVEKGVQALADFAGGMTLDPKEIDKERGVVIEEWRGGLGAGSRLRDQQIPVLFAKSKYAERLPIGKPEILKTFRPSELRAFYTKWYRPDRMAVVAVGDMDPATLEALIKKEFGAAGEARDAGAGTRLPAASAIGSAGQDGDRRRGDAVLGLHRSEARARVAGQGQRLSPQPGELARLRDAERPVRRDLAQGRRAVLERGRLRRGPYADGQQLHARRERSGGQDRAGPGRPRGRGQSRRAARLRGRRARPRA